MTALLLTLTVAVDLARQALHRRRDLWADARRAPATGLVDPTRADRDLLALERQVTRRGRPLSFDTPPDGTVVRF